MPITQAQLNAVREKTRDLAIAVSHLAQFVEKVHQAVNAEQDFPQTIAGVEAELIAKYAVKRAAVVTALSALPVVNP